MVRPGCALACLLFALPAAVQAAPDVVLSHGADLHPGLCDALRIQLTPSAVLCSAHGPVSGTLAERIEALAVELRAAHARLGVFIVEEGTKQVQLVVVGEREDSAILIFEPRRGGPRPELDRSLALKVVEVLDAVSRADLAPASGEHSEVQLGVALAARPAQSTPEPARRYALLLEGGYGARFDWSARGVANAAGGLRVGNATAALELDLAAALPAATRVSGETGVLELRRYDVAFRLRALRHFGRVELGAQLAAGMSAFSASASADSGTRGRGQAFRGELSFAPVLRVGLFATAYLSFAPSVAVAPALQEFVIDGDTTLRLSRVRVDLPLSLGVRTP